MVRTINCVHSDIKRIVDVVNRRENVQKFSKVVSRDEIRDNDYNLNISRYVDSSEAAGVFGIFYRFHVRWEFLFLR